jgi:hypothetical protein
MVGANRVELLTSCLSSKRSNQLSYAPKGARSIEERHGVFKWLKLKVVLLGDFSK